MFSYCQHFSKLAIKPVVKHQFSSCLSPYLYKFSYKTKLLFGNILTQIQYLFLFSLFLINQKASSSVVLSLWNKTFSYSNIKEMSIHLAVSNTCAYQRQYVLNAATTSDRKIQQWKQYGEKLREHKLSAIHSSILLSNTPTKKQHINNLSHK